MIKAARVKSELLKKVACIALIVALLMPASIPLDVYATTAPTINPIANQTMNEDGFIGVPFTVSGTITSITATSSNTSLVNADSGIFFGGSGTSRTAAITPVANQNGSVDITITVSNGFGSASRTFQLTVSPVNDQPMIDSPFENITVDEDTPTPPIAFTISDTDIGTNLDNLILEGSSSNQTLVPNGNVVFAGSGADRTVTVTPAANQTGTTTIEVKVKEGSDFSGRTFVLTVVAANDAPTIVPIEDQTIAVGETSKVVNLTVADIDSSVNSLTVTTNTGNPTLVPSNGVVAGGSGANRTLTITPVPGYSGTSVITVMVSDGSLSAVDTFLVTVDGGPGALTAALSLSSSTVENGNAVGTEVGTFSSSGIGVGTPTYSLVTGDGSADNHNFLIRGSTLLAMYSFDIDVKPTYSIRVRATIGTQSVEAQFTVVVIKTSNNLAPTSLTLSNNKVSENAWVGYEIGTFAGTDPNENDNLTFSFAVGEGDDDNSDFTIQGTKLKTASVLEFATKSVHMIRVRATDSGGKFFEKMFAIEITQANATLNSTNKVLSIHFDDLIFTNTAKTGGKCESDPPLAANLKDSISITNNANALDGGTYNPLGAEDTVTISKNRLVITFKNQITGNYNRIKVAKCALKDRFNYRNDEVITTPLAVDVTGPSLTKVTMSKNKKIIALRFSEKVYRATTGATSAEAALNFFKAFQIKRGTADYAPLISSDKIAFSGRFIILTLRNPLITQDNRIKIDNEALKDIIGNKSAQVITPEIEDIAGPTIKRVTLNADNRRITVLFNEDIYNNLPGTTTQRAVALKNAITVSANAGPFNSLALGDTVAVGTNSITVRLATQLSGTDNRLRIDDNVFKDLFGNKNQGLITSFLTADSVGPICKTKGKDANDNDVCSSVSLPSKKLNKQLVISFNERIANGMAGTSSSARAAALKAAITIKVDTPEVPGVSPAVEGTFAPLKSKDIIRVYGNTVLIFFYSTLAVGKNYTVKINENALQDVTGNKVGEVVSKVFQVDTSGPVLR